MDAVNIFNQMAKYDFSTPINATVIFEDSDEDAPLIDEDQIEINEKNPSLQLNVQAYTEKEQANHMSDVRKPVLLKKETIDEVLEQNPTPPAKNINYSSAITESTQTLNNPGSTEITSPHKTNENVNRTSTHNIGSGETYDKSHYQSDTFQQISDTEELTTYVKDLLNTLSEHLILVIKYHYYYQNLYQQSKVTQQLATYLNKLKSHFFNLSYSILVSIILPQEKNEIFIETFIDKTVSDANKTLLWKCDRTLVERFYKEMVQWAKVKRDIIKALRYKNSNDNPLLKKRLATPVQPPPNFPNLTTVFNQHNGHISNTQNSFCLFSTGPPGGEVSINIDPETLQKHTGNRSHIQRTSEQSNNQICSPNTQAAPTETHHEYTRTNHLQQSDYPQINNTLLQRPPPPAYPQNLPSNLHKFQENIAQALQQQRQAQFQRNVSAPFTTTVCNNSMNLSCAQGSPPYYFNSQITAGQRYSEQSAGALNLPVINDVRSLNHMTCPLYAPNGRCCICGKKSDYGCPKCVKHYCSSLCQELDADSHRTVCK
ncbi:uncharacterized protein LOC142977669 [Anticarsia gemmatalis]|uniref:uncharacterized protein LOC142977669 n=1 Tax=Anticarsia gemmatalis TaxID=129554 RepID=UPI003F757F88